MRYIKKFEKLNEYRPMKVDDYVICENEAYHKREIPLIEFINNNIGRIKKIGGHKINNIFYPSNYLVEYFNIPEELENYFIEGGYCIRMIESQIKWWSENKEDLEDIIMTQKYNL